MKKPCALLLTTALVCVGSLSLLFGGCSSEDDSIQDAGNDVEQTPAVDRVDIDLDDYLEGAPNPDGSVEVFEVTDTDQLIDGAAATGRVGDFVVANDRVRFVIERDERKIGPCPWGGNVIDAASTEQEAGGDILDEICLFLNADQTFKPESYEVLADGSDGPGILAVTGRTAVLDYLNVEAMIADMSAALANSYELKPDGLLPLRITQYYILRPGDQGVRVVTALRNDGDEALSIVPSHLVVSGADGSYFNPLSELGGFGYVDAGLADPDPDTLPFLALVADDTGVAYMPRPDENLSDDLPIGGAYLTIFNVAASVLGQTDILGTLLASRDELSRMEGVLQLESGDIKDIEHWTFAGDGALSTIVDVIYGELGVSTGTIDGVVRDGDGEPVAASYVSAVDDEGRTMNQTVTGADGEYQMAVPAGVYQLSARGDDHFTVDASSVSVDADQAATPGDILTEAMGVVSVSVTTPDGEPTPARITLICQGDCPHKATSNEREVTFDGLPDEFATVEWVGVSGELDFRVAEGDYRVVVSRGMEYSLWPGDGSSEVVAVSADETTEINAELARVVDTSGALSGDFHVHSLSSLDSTTPKQDRVLSFLSEGVDVLVSSDHDVVADFGPAVDGLGAGDEMATITGNEVTTIDIGHFNAFPLERDVEDRRGGALDWGAGADLAMQPADIYASFREHPGKQVVQINHPDSSYLRFSDVVRGISYGDRDRMRVQTPDYDADTGDTGLWSDEFSAMELMNGPRMDRFWGVTRWWLTLVGRGHLAAGTAVTDTHTRYGRNLGGVPRTFVFVDDETTTAADFETTSFIHAVNSQQAIGTNGPFVRVQATNDAGDTASFGDTVETNGEAVQFALTIEVPEWIDVDRIEMVKNSTDVVTDPGEYNTDPIEPTQAFDIELGAEYLEVVAQGEYEHRRYRKVVDIDVETGEDAYVVFFIHGSGSMYPVVTEENVEPFAFTNPVYLDVDGTGYSSPPLADLAASEPPESHPSMLVGDDSMSLDEIRNLSHDELMEYVDEVSHHGHHHH